MKSQINPVRQFTKRIKQKHQIIFAMWAKCGVLAMSIAMIARPFDLCAQVAVGFSCSCMMDTKTASTTVEKNGHGPLGSDSDPATEYKIWATETDTSTGSEGDFSFSQKIKYSRNLSSWYFVIGESGAVSAWYPTNNPTVYSGGGSDADCSWTWNSDGSITGCDGEGEGIEEGMETLAYDASHDAGATNVVTPTDSYSFWSSGDLNYSMHVVLTDEVTDELVRGEVMAHLPAYPDDWSGGGQAVAEWDNFDHIWLKGGKLKYRLKVPATSEKDALYEISWKETTTTVTYSFSTETYTTKAISTDKSGSVKGTGDPINPAYGDEVEVNVPSASGNVVSVTIKEGTPTITKITQSGGGPPGGPPSGPRPAEGSDD